LCEGVYCSGHGTCKVQQGVPICVCDAGYHAEGLDCVEDCQPTCKDKCCGTDGCGGTCPNRCPDTGQTCNLQTCECEGPCQPSCHGRVCGPDGCEGTCPPGCGSGEICNEVTGQCECVPICQGRECGPDGCGSTCPPGCGAGEQCNETTGQCECVPICQGRECGPDMCGGTCPPGCDVGEECNETTGQCECVPNCTGMACGPDGCGGNCPPGCEEAEVCVGGTCQEDPAALIWVEIPGGSFMMGSENGEDNERPVHRVTVPTFEITKTEVTVVQYQACVDASICTEPIEPTLDQYCNLGKTDREDHPVNCVDWEQAGVFCRWSGGRLPTEAQWEYAARGGGDDIEFPWGDQPATCYYAVMDDQTVGGDGCGQDLPWPVCSKTAGNTAHGLCDMSGNVFEWVRDQYHDSYIGAPTDGSSWEDLWFADRVCRGSSYNSGPQRLRASFRDYGDRYVEATRGYAFFGIRCARPVDP
jgi:formylglycine-generating enzyme required for sulfatase activity